MNDAIPNQTDSARPALTDEQRRIRSFVLRQGRLTGGQARAMLELLPKFGVQSGAKLDLRNLFGNTAPVVLEIGIGNGDALAHCALADPDRNYIGAEVHAPGVGHALLAIEAANLKNVRIYHGDAVTLLVEQCDDASLDQVNIWFPDPWHKARHNKRRLVQPAFVAAVVQKLAADGLLHLATDWQPYAEHMLAVLSDCASLKNCAEAGAYMPKPNWRPSTHFERRGERLGHGVWDLLFRKVT
jgi:tRNA (guanine-N7-)-methyltransferase